MAVMQQRRTATPNNAPPNDSLAPGVFVVEMASNPARLWVGTDPTLGFTGNRRVVVDSSIYATQSQLGGPTNSIALQWTGTQLTANVDGTGNPGALALASQLGNYLPLTGGTIHRANANDPLTIYADETQYARMHFAVDNTRDWLIGTNADGNFSISDNTAPRTPLYIDVSGHIGIGGNLTAAAGSVTAQNIIASQGYLQLLRPTLRAWAVAVAPDATFRITDETAGGVARLSIDLSGHIGIGGNLDAPYGSLKGINLICDGGYVQLQRPAVRTWALGIVSDGSFRITDETSGGVSRLSIDSLGTVGIGANLDVPYGSAKALNLISDAGYIQLNRPTVRAWSLAVAANASFVIADETAPRTPLTIDALGNMSVGSTNVAGILNITGTFATAGLQFNGGNRIYMAWNGTELWVYIDGNPFGRMTVH